MPVGIYPRKQLTDEQKAKLGGAWRGYRQSPAMAKAKKRARKPKPIPPPRAWPCPTCMVETRQLQFCQDCAAVSCCVNCVDKHNKAYHSLRPRRWMHKLPPLTGEHQ